MNSTRRSVRIPAVSDRRFGFTTPAVAVGLLVVMMGLALIIDRTWLEIAKLELLTAAESAALGAARELASEDSLLANAAVELRLNNARETAGWVASHNTVGGASVTLNTEPEGDIRFGSLVLEQDGLKFDESNDNPTTVVVTALRTRSNNNPIALFLSGVSHLPYGDVAVRAAATVENDVAGLKPFEGTAIPALPMAIWEVDPTGQRSDTWVAAIETSRGADQYAFDAESHQVISDSDGIPELVLRNLTVGGEPDDVNMQVLDIGTEMNNPEVVRQIQTGIAAGDLEPFGGSILVGQGATIDFSSSPKFDPSFQNELQNMIGQCRICLLYSKADPQRQPPLTTSTCTRVVAIRIMSINGNRDGSFTMTVQPTVMTSRSVILASENLDTNSSNPNEPVATDSEAGTSSGSTSNPPVVSGSATANRYVYKLRLTH